jgi:hypothetical protein
MRVFLVLLTFAACIVGPMNGAVAQTVGPNVRPPVTPEPPKPTPGQPEQRTTCLYKGGAFTDGAWVCHGPRILMQCTGTGFWHVVQSDNYVVVCQSAPY